MPADMNVEGSGTALIEGATTMVWGLPLAATAPEPVFPRFARSLLDDSVEPLDAVASSACNSRPFA